MHRTITKISTDPNEKFEKFLTLQNTDPYYFCGLQFKYLSADSSSLTQKEEVLLTGLKARICQIVVIRQFNITYLTPKMT